MDVIYLGRIMKLRESNIEKLKSSTFDVLIVGGGINGAVCAAALSSKGVKAALIEKGDFASHTSQESSNLAWGGIKYLETYEFLLVRKLCKSRNYLIKNYPSSVKEIRFLAIVPKNFRRPLWLMWLGTWFYWFVGNCFTKIPKLFFRKDIEREEKVINTLNCTGGIEYSDAYFYDNDARFVFNFIRNALNSGCVAANYVQSLGAKFVDGFWVAKTQNLITNEKFEIKSKVLINATGPFVDQHNELCEQKTQHRHVFSKGIHLIVDQITPNNRVLAFFADDGRLFFVIPMANKTCIGTTDTRIESPITKVTQEDRDFVLNNINKLLKLPKPLDRNNIIAERCGVRPLVVKGETEETDWLQLSRKHAIDVNEETPYISIFGGKLTDCLNIGKEISLLVKKMGIKMPYPQYKWYGEPPKNIRKEFFHQAKLMNINVSERLWRRYGVYAISLLENIRKNSKEQNIIIEGSEYLGCEIRQIAQSEMVVKLEDFLRRRSKIAQVIPKQTLQKSPGIKEVCKILFEDQAEEKFKEYFHDSSYGKK